MIPASSRPPGAADETITIVSDARQQTFIQAPRRVVWELIADVERHADWWPDVIEVDCDQVAQGCQYREVIKVPFGTAERQFEIEDLDDPARFSIRCVNTGAFCEVVLTDAQGGTFVEGRAGLDPRSLRFKVFDAVAGQRYFTRWLEQSLAAMERVAVERAGQRA
ncbi:MAG: Polyketide cyclase / dehydrase and lipid transport [Solirubrobacterales bacterium]|jgi:uncharacterized protein YndB with AHSA1/START domain|nr:Polyketide cyclase / dehydrase and lipid transport [Solirubrobacterales bacterium]